MVGNYRITQHAGIRMQQRGICNGQIELVMKHGEPTDDGYVMTKRAVDESIAELKHEIKMLEKLKNVNVIDINGSILTAYRVSDRRVHRMLHR
jgi:hypothetical protein